jgi:hypothetical protein
MKVADILRTLANNLEHAEGGMPDPRIQNPAGWTVTNGMSYAEYLTAWAGGNFTISTTAALIGTVVELY